MATNVFGKIASSHTIKDVRDFCNKQGFTFERDKRYTCRRYVIIEKKTNIENPVAFIPTMDEMYSEFETLGIVGFINKYKATVNRTTILGATKQAVKVTGASKSTKPKKVTKKSLKEAERQKKLAAKQAKLDEKAKKEETKRQKKELREAKKRREENQGEIDKLIALKTDLCVRRLSLDCPKTHPEYVALQTQIIELREKIKELQ